MKLLRDKNFISRSLILTGSIILLFSLSVDTFKGGGQPASFGFRQVIGMVLGFLLVCCGTIFFLRNSDSSLRERIQTHKTSLAVFMAVALGLSWLLYIYNAGIRFSPDSVAYQSFALKMHHIADFDTGATWPPLYPILIHIVMYIQRFPAGAAAIISGLSMIGVLTIFALILCKYSNDVALIIVFIASLFFWDKFLYIYTPAWSEPPFAFILVLALFCDQTL